MGRAPRIALIIETSREYGRGLLRGISLFQREHCPWSIYFQPRGDHEPAPSWLSSWHGDGILARVENRKMADLIHRTGVPVVDLRFGVPGLDMPAVGIDNRTVVQLAIDHFLDRGFHRFAFCGTPAGQLPWMDKRRELFIQMTAEADLQCQIYEDGAKRKLTWEQDQRRLIRWLKSLEKPTAIMACNDHRGLQLLDACRQANIGVPDEISVLGVDNDEFLCGLSTPPLSSIDINLERIGYRAAELLQSMVDGSPPPSDPILLPAEAVVARKSTDNFAVEDAEFAEVLRYLRENACKGIRMTDVTRATGMERRTLQRRMMTTLGRSPKDELIRIQIDEAKRLLRRTDKTVKEISKLTGFESSRYFSRVFQSRTGLKPGQFRQEAKAGTD